MANAAALIQEGMWRRDKEFRALPRLAQTTYVQLLSQKDLDCAGVLTLHTDLLVKGCDEFTLEDLWADLKVLEAHKFVFVDADTDELFIRSYMRLVTVKSPNAYKSALRAAKLINSPKIRMELAGELRRLGRKDATELADELNPSGRDSEGVAKGYEPHPEGESLSDPPVTVTVSGSVTSVSGQVGGDDPPPPNPHCSKHRDVAEAPNCHGCKAAREQREAWDWSQTARLAERRKNFREEVLECPECDDRGWVEFDEGVKRCDQHDWSQNG